MARSTRTGRLARGYCHHQTHFRMDAAQDVELPGHREDDVRAAARQLVTAIEFEPVTRYICVVMKVTIIVHDRDGVPDTNCQGRWVELSISLRDDVMPPRGGALPERQESKNRKQCDTQKPPKAHKKAVACQQHTA